MDWDFITDEIRPQCDNDHFCGLHGRAPVDPDGPQVDLNHRGGCGYCRVSDDGEQLSFNL